MRHMPHLKIARRAHLQMSILLHALFFSYEGDSVGSPESITISINMHSASADWRYVPICMYTPRKLQHKRGTITCKDNGVCQRHSLSITNLVVVVIQVRRKILWHIIEQCQWLGLHSGKVSIKRSGSGSNARGPSFDPRPGSLVGSSSLQTPVPLSPSGQTPSSGSTSAR